MTLAEVLDAERARQSLTVYAVAKRANVSQNTTGRILTGDVTDPNWETVLALLAALGKDLAWLAKQLDK